MWGVQTPDAALAKIEEQRRNVLNDLQGREPANLEEQALSLVGRDIYEKLIKGYTEKQWGRKCTELPAFIIKRLPIRLVFDNNYFNDKYQGVPIGGYNKLIEALLCGSEVKTGLDFFDKTSPYNSGNWRDVANRLVYTGPIDEFYDYVYGKLEYRTVRFETELLNEANHQGNAVVNYTEGSVPFTRVIEHKHFEMFGPEVYENPRTVISREYSEEYRDGMEPYYPINNERNNSIAEKYRSRSMSECDIVFGGRLAEYKYYDMAPVIEKVLNLDV